MSLLDVGLYVSGFWAVLYLIKSFRQRRTSTFNNDLLGQRALTKSRSSDVQLQACFLRLETRTLNNTQEKLATWLVRSPTWKWATTAFYDIGSLCSLVGMLLAQALLLWSIYFFAGNIFSTGGSYILEPTPTTLIHKRDWQDIASATRNDSPPTSANGSPISLLIPGVTIPTPHFIPLLLMLFLAQSLHEVGHAIAAAVESIPILSCGASLTVIIPAAFVSLPTQAVQRCSARGRMRITASGPFHNLVIWSTLALWSSLGFGPFFWSLAGFEYVGHFGRAVTDISFESPLREYIPVGSVITKLDDTPLISSSGSDDPWVTYLMQPAIALPGEIDLGWCVARYWVTAQDDTCCTSRNESSNLSCFTSLPSSTTPSIQRCLAPLKILNAESSRRCQAVSDCSETDLCILPKSKGAVLRIEFLVPDDLVPGVAHGDLDAHLRTIVWSGPREEILEDVEVSSYRANLSFVPRQLPSILGLFIQYLSTLSLSLYLLNLLPLHMLDGGQLLDAALDFIQPTRDDEYDLESLEAGDVRDRDRDDRSSSKSSWAKKTKRYRNLAHTTTLCLLGSSVIFGLLNAIMGI
ncbi:hypothetical protein QCA50_007302 [Cerrena zonata]|uniref:Endopeptidase S2P n=1 Tax=Cerrena zonata TaxID=2478898 RepID=A0AAW0GED2_9APHY